MWLSRHIEREEFEISARMPDSCIVPYTNLCRWILEPIREQFQCPVLITSGFRTPLENSADNGNEHSEHMASANWCAADWFFTLYERNMRPVFDWIRNSQLPFHIVTLEHGKNGDIIHISWNNETKERLAKEGHTNNLSAYTNWPVVGISSVLA